MIIQSDWLLKMAAAPRWQFFAIIVSGSIALSELLVIFTFVLFDADSTTIVIGLVSAFVIPLIAAGACTYVLLEILRELKLAHQKAERLAHIDALTGVLNRRRFSEIARAALLGYSAQGRPTSLILLDVDNFKQINDKHGHSVGDVVLQMLAATVTRCARTQDAVARWGGEEFVLLIPGEGHDAAMEIAERVRKSIAQEKISANGTQLTITASVGLVTHQPNAQPDLDALISSADAAMYLAKTQGKNRVMMTPVAAMAT